MNLFRLINEFIVMNRSFIIIKTFQIKNNNNNMVEAVSQRDQIRDELIVFANGFLENWENYADKEFRSNDLGFEFVSR